MRTAVRQTSSSDTGAGLSCPVMPDDLHSVRRIPARMDWRLAGPNCRRWLFCRTAANLRSFDDLARLWRGQDRGEH